MASSLVFPLAGLTDLGGQAFKGLLEGEELERRERERQQKMQHQGFLERLESERLRMQEEHNRATEQRLNQYLQRGQHLSLGGGRVMQVLPDGSTRIIDAGAAPETPAQKASRELTEAQTVEARRRTDLLGQPKTPQIPAEHAQMYQDWQRTHPGSTYLDFYQSVVKPPAAEKPPPTPFQALVDSTDPRRSPDERARLRRVYDQFQEDQVRAAQDKRPEKISKADDPLLGQAAHWSDEQGRHPSPLDTPRQAVARGMRPFQGKVPPEVASGVTLMAVDQVLSLVEPLRKKGLLASGPGLLPSGWTAFQRNIWQRGDPDLTTFISHTSTLVRTARELGDIGFRAQAAIRGTTDLVEKAQTADGVAKALFQLRNLLVLAAPATVPRTLRGFNTKTNQYVNVTLDPGETLNDVPMWIDPNR